MDMIKEQLASIGVAKPFTFSGLEEWARQQAYTPSLA